MRAADDTEVVPPQTALGDRRPPSEGRPAREFRGSRTAENPASPALPSPRPAALLLRVSTLFLLAPFFLLFEFWQLVLSERYLGIKQIARGANARELGLGEITAFFWTVILIAYWIWMVLLFAFPVSRFIGLGLFVLSGIGFTLRRGAPLKWMLVILTFEGALRIGLLILLCGIVWHRL